MVPRRPIHAGASRVTGFRVTRQRLFLHGRPVLTNTLRESLVSFISFIHMLGRPLLAGHNIRRFDCHVLARALDEFSLRWDFQRGVSGFLDTLPLARQLLKHTGLQSFTQENLMKNLLPGVSYASHDALEDARALQELYWALTPTANHIQQHVFALDSLTTAGVKKTCDSSERFTPAVNIPEEPEEHRTTSRH